jgi:hypothetical protein
MMGKRLVFAYLISPWGAALPLLGFYLVAFAVDPFPIDIITREVTRTVPWAYLAGLVLLPVYFLFERLGWRGWRVYVPTAVAAGIVLPIGVGAARFLWEVRSIAATGSGGIGAVSVGTPFLLLGAIGGGLSGVVFSIVLGNTPQSAGEN